MRTASCLLLATALLSCASDDPTASDDDRSADEDLTAKVVTNGSFAGRFSSPTIVRVADTLHGYFAKQRVQIGNDVETFNVPHATRRNGTWSLPHEALPHLGEGAEPNGSVWAPAVAEITSDRWMLYYAARIKDGEKMCIWRAHSTSPHGPFVDDYSGPLVCQSESLWAIDPYVVRDAHGNWHLVARIDLGNTINSIQIRQLGPEGGHFAPGSEWHLLAKNSLGSWDHHVMENAGVVRLTPPSGPPHWFVFYSAREWENDSYAIGYADCGEHIDGGPSGCRKVTKSEPWMASNAGAELYGPGTPTFYTDTNGHEVMSIQAWRYKGGVAPGSPNQAKNSRQGQIMHTYKISIDNAYHPHAVLERTDE